MTKKAVSVTLEYDNLLWLKGQASGARSLSHTLDRLVTEARRGGKASTIAIRSVAGSVVVNPDDPLLDKADAFIRSQFVPTSMARARPPTHGQTRAARARKAFRRGR
jgi:hypothetical protein